VLLEGSLMTEEHWNYVVSSQLFLIIITRVPMIVTAFQTKSMGANAFATFFLAFVGTVARTATVIAASDDFMYRLQFFMGLGFNTIIMVQFAMYWNAKPEKKRAKIVGPGATNKATKIE
jgi:hypothetical protein